MLKKLFVYVICISFLGDVMTANSARREFDYYDFSNPDSGYKFWTEVINSFKSDEFINAASAASSENRWEESSWNKKFYDFCAISFGTNLWSPHWSIDRRHKAGDIAQEVLDFLINQSINHQIKQSIIQELESIISSSKRTAYCHQGDYDNDGNTLHLQDLDNYEFYSNR